MLSLRNEKTDKQGYDEHYKGRLSKLAVLKGVEAIQRWPPIVSQAGSVPKLESSAWMTLPGPGA
jgi:hypothetical protein